MVGWAHFRRSRTIQTSPHWLHRRDTKCAVKAAIAAAVAAHSGHRSTLRADSATGNWIMVSEILTQALPFANHLDGLPSLIERDGRTPRRR